MHHRKNCIRLNHRVRSNLCNQAQQSEERDRRKEVETIFRMMDTDSDGYLSVEVRHMSACTCFSLGTAMPLPGRLNWHSSALLQEANRLGKLLGITIPERHSVHVRGVSLHQFMGWGKLGKSRCWKV